VSPDGQRTGTDGLVSEVVASVFDNEAKIGPAGEVNGKLDLLDVGDGY